MITQVIVFPGKDYKMVIPIKQRHKTIVHTSKVGERMQPSNILNSPPMFLLLLPLWPNKRNNNGNTFVNVTSDEQVTNCCLLHRYTLKTHRTEQQTETESS